jgi:hypothetical protein
MSSFPHLFLRVGDLGWTGIGAAGSRTTAPEESSDWSFYILLVTFMGISPGGARESSPWREPWEQTRTARSPGGAKEPFHGDSPIAGHEGPSYAPTGLARLWPVPQGLRPGLFSSAPNGASNRARTRLARREELGIKAQTRVENVETPEAGQGAGRGRGRPPHMAPQTRAT